MEKEIAVVALILVNTEKKLFLAKRPDFKGQDWEFPGGKVEAGESNEEALVREIQEELSIRVSIDFYLGSQAVSYNNKSYRIYFFASRYQGQSIFLTEHTAGQWFDFSELSEISISPGNLLFVQNSQSLKQYLDSLE